MTTEPAIGWRREIGHDGVFVASLDLWPLERAGKTRPVQSGYRALWSLGVEGWLPLIEEGPIDLVEGRSIVPGQTRQILIHPMRPEGWIGIGAGARLPLVARTQDHRQIGLAVVEERRNVPAAAPLNLKPFEETPARVMLRASMLADGEPVPDRVGVPSEKGQGG